MAEKFWYKGCQRMKPKIISCYMPYSTPVNLVIAENTCSIFMCLCP